MCGPQNSLSFVGSRVADSSVWLRQGMKSAEIRSVCFDEGLILKTSNYTPNLTGGKHINPNSPKPIFRIWKFGWTLPLGKVSTLPPSSPPPPSSAPPPLPHSHSIELSNSFQTDSSVGQWSLSCCWMIFGDVLFDYSAECFCCSLMIS